jgi:hypothetical protein
VSSPTPRYQRVLVWVPIGLAVWVTLGSVLDALSNTIAWISAPVTYIGSLVLLAGLAIVSAWLRFVGLDWTVGGQRTTLRGLGRYGAGALLLLVIALWIPRVAERLRAPDRAAIPWAEMLDRGHEVIVDIGEVPDHMGAGRGRMPHEATYRVRFQRETCIWRTVGPWKLPPEENGVTIPDHIDEAGPSFRGSFTRQKSETGMSECSLPERGQMVVMGIPVEFDRRGVLSFGGREHRFGALRIPWRWYSPGTWGDRYTGQEDAR